MRRMAKANASGARYAIILGDDELQKNVAALKNLDSGEQQTIELDRLAKAIVDLSATAMVSEMSEELLRRQDDSTGTGGAPDTE